MAFQSKLGEAFVELRARHKRFSSDLRAARGKALGQVQKLSSSVRQRLGGVNKGIALAAGAAIAGATVALVRFVRKAIEAADALGKNSRALGLNVEAYQELEFAASQAGIPQEQFLTGLRNLGRRIAEADSGLETYARSFRRFGIETRDAQGELRSVDDVLLDLAEGYARTTDETEKIFHAMNLFGRAGARMVNFLNLGRRGIEEFRSEARRLGIVLDAEMVHQAEEAADQIDRLQRVIGVNLRRALLTLTPLVIRFSAGLAEAGPSIAGFIERFAPASLVGVEELDRRLQQTRELLEQIESGPHPQSQGVVNVRAELAELEELRERAMRAEKAIRAMFEAPQGEELQQVLQQLRFELDQLGRDAFEKRVEALLRQTDGAGRSQIENLVREIEARKEINARLDEYRRLLDEAKTPLERFHDRWTQLLADLQAGKIDKEQFDALLSGFGQDLEDEQSLASLGDEAKTVFQEMEELVSSWGNRFADEMAQALLTGELTFRSLAQSFLREFVRTVLAQTVFNPLFRALGQSFGNLGSTGTTATVDSIAGARQHGGSVGPGRSFLVGEAGPELFLPSSAGRIVPNDELGGGPQVTQHFHFTTGLDAEVRAQLLKQRAFIAREARQAVAGSMTRGGRFASLLEGQAR